MHRPILFMSLVAVCAPIALVACNGDDDNTGRFVDAGPKNYANEPPPDGGAGDATVDGGGSDAQTDASDATVSDAGDAGATDSGSDADAGPDPCATDGGDAGFVTHTLDWNLTVVGQTLTINKCDSVIWHNSDSVVTHSIVSTTFSAPDFGPGTDSVAIQFKTVGAFAYHCGHHATMTGTMTVQ